LINLKQNEVKMNFQSFVVGSELMLDAFAFLDDEGHFLLQGFLFSLDQFFSQW